MQENKINNQSLLVKVKTLEDKLLEKSKLCRNKDTESKETMKLIHQKWANFVK